MPHESATAALKTVRFPGAPFHDSFHAAAPEEDAYGSWQGCKPPSGMSHPWVSLPPSENLPLSLLFNLCVCGFLLGFVSFGGLADVVAGGRAAVL